jgi:hypothetical protein
LIEEEMMDRNETFQNSRSDDLLWGSPVTAIELDPTPIDEWFKDKDLDKLCAEEFTFSNCKTSNNIDANLEIDYAPVLDLVYDEFQQFLDLLGPKCVITSNFEVPWINVYEEGGFQDSHDHQGDRYSDFSWCYVHETGNSHIVFKNRYATNSDACLKDLLAAYEAHQVYVPRIKDKGTLYIFPSTIFHAVSPNKCAEPRITLSGNIKLTPDITSEGMARTELIEKDSLKDVSVNNPKPRPRLDMTPRKSPLTKPRRL